MADQQERLGQTMGDYRLVQWLGGGGFGNVYLAEHLHHQIQVAIKILATRLTKADDWRSFLNEARMVRLRHPHIMPLLDFGLSRQNEPFLVMDYAPRGTLRDRYPKGSRMPLPTIVHYATQVASALQYAHEQRLIHRDVKPENMLLRSDDWVLLSDFGISTAAHSTHSFTANAGISGTVPYMAPEQLDGKPHPASDQYALAVVIYEWLTGLCPFVGTTVEVVVQHATKSPPSLRAQVLGLPSEVEEVLFRALAKDPRERFASMHAFVNALRQASTLPSLNPFIPSGVMDAPSLGQSPLSGTVESFPLNESTVNAEVRPPTLGQFTPNVGVGSPSLIPPFNNRFFGGPPSQATGGTGQATWHSAPFQVDSLNSVPQRTPLERLSPPTISAGVMPLPPISLDGTVSSFEPFSQPAPVQNDTNNKVLSSQPNHRRRNLVAALAGGLVVLLGGSGTAIAFTKFLAFSCSSGQTDCSGTCTNLKSDSKHCGACGNACGSGKTCVNGACKQQHSCISGQTDCSGICTNLKSDSHNCGACSNACGSGTTCVDGTCQQQSCPSGQVRCSGTCIHLNSDSSNCGSCGNVCGSGKICVNGTCCFACNGACADTNSDSSNCGSCGNVCGSSKTCVNGTCQCSSGQNCKGVCVNASSDSSNCGSCGNVCGSGKTCVNGTCQCSSGQNCNGVCVNTGSDSNNCGSCGHVCPSNSTCVGGTCQCTYATCGSTCCSSGYSCCNGACVNTSSNSSNCGSCGHTCTSGYASCVSGTCQCTYATCSNGKCCSSGYYSCCNNTCIYSGETCCGSYYCYSGYSCCGSGCMLSGHTCCGSYNCNPGYTCYNGGCI